MNSTYEVCLKRNGTDCVCCMNMLYSSDKSLVVLRSTILGSCANESSALCNNHTLCRLFCSGTLVKFVEIIIKNCDFCLVVKR